MTGPRLLGHQVHYEQLAFWRNPQSAFFTFAFPIMFLVVFASLNKGQTIADLGGISFNQYYIPAIVAFGLMGSCYTNLAIGLTNRRETGALKRLRSTPLAPWALFGGLVINALIITLILAVLTITVGVLFYDVHLPYRVLPLVVSLALGAATFCGLGVAVSGLIPNADAAPAIVQFPFFLLTFISGTFFPAPEHSLIARIASFFPLVHLTDASFAAFDPRVHGSGFRGGDLLVLSAWAAAAGVVAVRRFRWEPGRP